LFFKERIMPASVCDPFDAIDDPCMRSLRLALDPIEAERQIRRLMSPAFGPRDRIRLRSISVTRHKPGKRCLVEYVLKGVASDGGIERITLIGKSRARRFGSADYRLHSAIWNAGWRDDSPDGFSVPRPIGVAPKLQMWLQRKITGCSATELISGPDGESLARKIAEAAHKLHRSPVPVARRHTIGDELRILRQCLESVMQREPSWLRRIERLWHACQRLANATPEPVPTCIHRDFYADQIIVQPGTDFQTADDRPNLEHVGNLPRQPRLYLLDFDLYCFGDPALDIGNFIGHITEQSLRTRGDPSRLSHIEQALEDHFVELSGEAVRPAVQTYAALTLARHVYLSLRFPERRHLTDRLLELCEQRLGVGGEQHVTSIHERSVS
jgi:hypothetical protein